MIWEDVEYIFLELCLDVQVLVLRPFELESAVSIYYSMECIFSKL